MSARWACLAAVLAVVPGCFGAGSGLRVVATNTTGAPVQVDVWVNHTEEGSWHRVATVAAGASIALGAFHGPTHDDYNVTAVAAGHRIERAMQIDQGYRSWQLTVTAAGLDESMVVA
jgi:hypothetical protein